MLHGTPHVGLHASLFFCCITLPYLYLHSITLTNSLYFSTLLCHILHHLCAHCTENRSTISTSFATPVNLATTQTPHYHSLSSLSLSPLSLLLIFFLDTRRGSCCSLARQPPPFFLLSPRTPITLGFLETKIDAVK